MKLLLIVACLWACERVAMSKVDNDILESCLIEEDFFWEFYQSYFLDSHLVTINILHSPEHFTSTSNFADYVLKFSYIYTKLEKSVTVMVSYMGLRPGESVGYSEKTMSINPRERDANIILVWNTDILWQILNYHPERIIFNPRGKYAILLAYNKREMCFDWNQELNRLFTKLWKQYGISNVIAQSPCSCHPGTMYVYRPFIRHNFTWGLTEEIDIIDVLADMKIINNDMKDMDGYPLVVSMFERLPTSIKTPSKYLAENKMYQEVNSKAGYAGVDGCVVNTISKLMNFSVTFIETDYYMYGKILPNGTATGSLGDVTHRRAHLAANGRFVLDYGTNEFDFTSYIQNDYLCMVVPKSSRIPQWIMIFHGFSLYSWLGLLVTFIFMSCMWHFANKNCLFQEYRRRSVVLEIYSIVLSTPTKLIAPFFGHKLFLSACVLFVVIISSIFQGSLVTSFSTITFYPDMSTLEAVDKSGLPISTNLEILHTDNSSEIIRSLGQKQIISAGIWSLKRAAHKRDVVGLERKSDAKFYILQKFINDDGTPLLHIVPECVASYSVSFVVSKGLPFLHKFDYIIERLNEIGLTEKWYDDAVDQILHMGSKNVTRYYTEHKVFSIYDVQTAFYLYIGGILLSCIAFIGEHLYYKHYHAH